MYETNEPEDSPGAVGVSPKLKSIVLKKFLLTMAISIPIAVVLAIGLDILFTEGLGLNIPGELIGFLCGVTVVQLVSWRLNSRLKPKGALDV